MNYIDLAAYAPRMCEHLVYYSYVHMMGSDAELAFCYPSHQVIFCSTGRHFTSPTSKVLATPIYMDTVGCYGTESKLIDCTYHMDTSEDTHSGDIWIDCSSSTTREPDRNNDNDKSDGNNGHSSNDSNEESSEVTSNDNGSDNDVSVKNSESKQTSNNDIAKVSVILAAVSLMGFVLLSIVIGYILCKKQSGIHQTMG